MDSPNKQAANFNRLNGPANEAADLVPLLGSVLLCCCRQMMNCARPRSRPERLAALISKQATKQQLVGQVVRLSRVSWFNLELTDSFSSWLAQKSELTNKLPDVLCCVVLRCIVLAQPVFQQRSPL